MRQHPCCQAADKNWESQHCLVINTCKAARDRLYVQQIKIHIACPKSKVWTGNLFFLVLTVILKIQHNFWHFLLQLQLYLVFKGMQYLATLTAPENSNSTLQKAFAYSESITWNNIDANSQVIFTFHNPEKST